MRTAFSRVVLKWMSVICLVLVILTSISRLAGAQSVSQPKHRPLRQSVLGERSVASVSGVRSAKAVAPPPLTADTWTGTSGDNSWGTAGNWSSGVPTSTSAVTISTVSTNVNVNVTSNFGTLALSSGDTVNVVNAEVLNAYGNITNRGGLNLDSTGNVTELVLQGNVVLSGGGTLTLSNNANNYIFGTNSLDQLTNQETIQGAGHIGNNQMTLVNSGTIDANQSAGMTIQANDGFTNTGTVEATSGATLALSNMNINNTGGTISANASTLQVNSSTVNGGTFALTGASTLQLNSSVIPGGTITNSATGTIEIASGNNTLGGTINNSAGGILKVDNNTVLNLQNGTYAQLGAVQLNSSGNFTELVLQGNVTLSGGAVTLSNNANNYIFGQVSSDTLTNQETISGAGHIGNGQMTLVNTGTINSNQSAGMTIQASGGITNSGTLEATAGADLVITSSGVVNNTGGTIAANAGTLQVNSSVVNGGTVALTGASSLQLSSSTVNGAAITLSSGASLQMSSSTIHGGTLTNSSTGAIAIVSGSNELGGAINNATGSLSIDNNAILYLEGGTYSKLGAVQLNSSGNFTELQVRGDVTLSGGSVTLSNNANNYIFGQFGSDVLTNQETISGAGHIGNNQMTLVNTGTINSNQSAGMTIQASGGITNSGTLEATAGAALVITSSGVVSNTGGTIAANTGTLQVNSSTVNGGTFALTGASLLQMNSATIHGGSTITNSSTGTIEIASGTNALGGTINNSAGGILKIDNNTILDLESGTYSQLGTVQLNSSGNFTELVIEGNVTLGGGTLTMSANANNFIFGQVGSDVLTNEETIQGAGNIGNGSMGLVNSGTIIANASGNMVINVSNQNLNNTGTLEANGATLTIEGPGVTFFANDNQSTGTLTEGNLIANGSNIQWNAGPNNITTLAGSVTEEGGGQLINTFNNTNVNVLAGLTSITSAGALTIGGVTFTDADSFSNAGSLTLLAGESFAVGSLTQISGSSLTAGTYVLDANLNLSGTAQTITTNAATLTLAGGTIENTSNSTNALAGLATNSGKLTIGGASNAVSTTAASFSNPGTLTINGGDSFTATKLSQISGTTLSGGTYVLGGNLNLTTAGISIATNSATLTLQGGTINSNSVNALSALAANTKSLTLANNAKLTTTTTGNFANSGTVNVSNGSTLTVGGTGHRYNQTAGTTTVDGTLAGAANFTGGTIQGAGTVSGNVSAGNATGTAVTVNVGDSGKAGLLAITGTYTQLATGTMKLSIGGTTVGTQYSQLAITGAASLAGTLSAAQINAFVPTVGQTFTVLTASSVTGTFTNTTIAINSNEHYAVSYTATSVVLTVASGPASKSSSNNSALPVAQIAMASVKPAITRSKIPFLVSGSRQAGGTDKISKPVVVAEISPSAGRSNAILARGTALESRHSWERIPISVNEARSGAVARVPFAVNTIPSRTNQSATDRGIGQGRGIDVRAPLAERVGTSGNRRVPVKVLPPMMLRIAR